MVDVTQKMQEALSRLPRTDTYPFRSVLTPEYKREHIILSLTPANLLLAMIRAREAQELAVSYRDFRVGASVTALTFLPSRFEIMTGLNVKPDEHSSMNVHAEQVALQKARDRGADAVSMVVVIGETQTDTQSGQTMHTLHPCGLCRTAIKNNALIDEEASLIVSAIPSFQTIELYTLRDLERFHDGDPTASLQKFELPALELFLPVADEQKPIILEDSPRTLEEEDIWNDTVGVYLTERRLELLDTIT